MSKNLSKQILNSLGQNSQVVHKIFYCKKTKIELFYIESIVNSKELVTGVLSTISKFCENSENFELKNLESCLTVPSKIEKFSSCSEILNKIFSGFIAIVVDDKSLCFSLLETQGRGIEEPPTSKVVKGPREGFVEDLITNLSLVRKRIKTENFKVLDFYIGRQTKTHVSVLYVEGIAKQDIVETISKKLKEIDIDAILDSYYIESFLEDDKIKFFRRLGNTEKPDVLVSKILEGRVGILVDGSPIALTAPFLFFEDLQSPDDYYSIPAKATFARFMRIFGLIFAVLAPGIYVALQSYNYRLLPINFLISLITSIEGLSIPPIVEILVVLFLFEVITEASLQMPSALGMALSIIGALALGNTAVDAGIISPPSIVVVAISSVALYIIPDQIPETRIIRILFTVIGGIAGLYGMVMSFLILTSYMSSLDSFGIPYFSIYAPSVSDDKKDGIIKEELNNLIYRPKFIAGNNKKRQKDIFGVGKNNNKKTNKKTKENSKKIKSKNAKKRGNYDS